jgi:hypothetical protein
LFVDIITFWLLCTVYYYAVVSDLRQVGGFSLGSSTNKTDRHDITELLLKVALNTIKAMLEDQCDPNLYEFKIA